MTRSFLSLLTISLVVMLGSSTLLAQHKQVSRINTPSVRSLELIGIRPGISIDSVRRALASDGAQMREVPQDTLTRSFGDKSLQIFVADSIFCRLTYMRMSFVFDVASHHLRRFSITPRESSIAAGQDDDIDAALLLYFGEGWGKPEMLFDPPACFKWRTGNIEIRAFIKRGYPLWVMEG